MVGKVPNGASGFLLRAVSYRFGDEALASRMRALAAQIPAYSTAKLLKNAAYHELEPLLHLVASDCAALGHPLDLPRELTARWSQSHARETVRCTLIHQGAERALSALEEAGVRAIPLKGFYLASRFYARKGARGFKDLDVMVEEASLAGLNRALMEAGFKPAPDRPSFVPAPAYTVYSLPTGSGDTAMEIDIHVGMHWPVEYERRTRFRPRDIWDNAAQEEVEGMRIWAMSPEHLVITTLLDLAANHRYARLIKFRDLLEVLRATGSAALDWAGFEYWCERWQVRSLAAPGLRFVAEMDADVSVPAGTQERILPDYAAMRSFLRSLPLGALPDHRSRSFSLPNLIFFALSDTPGGRARGLLHLPGHILKGLRRF